MTSAATALPTLPPSSGSSFLHLGKTAVVCSEAILEGPFQIQIGEGTVVHPKAVISAKFGSVTIGANNIIEEFSVIRAPATASQGLTIGDYNSIRVGSLIEGNVGNGNVFECRSRIPPGASLNNGCILSATITLPTDQQISVADGTILYGANAAGNRSQRRREDLLQTNIADIKPKAVILDMLQKTHRILH